MPASTPAAFVAALVQSLVARANLAGVAVHLVAPGDLGLKDAIVLIRGPILGGQAWAALGRVRRDETYRIQSSLQTHRTGHDTLFVFQAAMDRAALILGEVVEQVRDDPPDVGDQTRNAIVTDISYQPLIAENGGWVVRCDFTIEVNVRLS